MSASHLSPARAFAGGAALVLRAPHLVVLVMVATLVMAAPFAVVLGLRLEASLSTQPPVSLNETEIDPEWWQQYRAHAQGLEATFTPAVLGFAAPLDGISAVLDGRRPPLAVFGPLALSIAVWSFLWGGLLRRFAARQAIGMRAFAGAGAHFAPRFFGISLAATVVIILLYVTVHAVLFGPVYRLLVPAGATEVNRLLARVALYLVFFAPLALVGLVADYARVASALGRADSLAGAIRAGAGFVRSNLRAVVVLYLVTGGLFVVITIAYGSLEIYGGSQVGGWRAVLIGQAYIVVRLAIRLTAAAAEVRLSASAATP